MRQPLQIRNNYGKVILETTITERHPEIVTCGYIENDLNVDYSKAHKIIMALPHRKFGKKYGVRYLDYESYKKDLSHQ